MNEKYGRFRNLVPLGIFIIVLGIAVGLFTLYVISDRQLLALQEQAGYNSKFWKMNAMDFLSSGEFNFSGLIFPVVLFLIGFIGGFVIITKSKKQTLIVDQNGVRGTTIFGKPMNLPFSAVASVSKILNDFIIRDKSGKKYIFEGLANRDEMLSAIQAVISGR